MSEPGWTQPGWTAPGWTAPGWTVDELAQHAAAALAAAGIRSPNGRVTARPDRRLIRWYATVGLLDPPLRARDRTARYGERHLLQLVAIKRRQAGGSSLTDIQAELAGATDAALHRIAALPPESRPQLPQSPPSPAPPSPATPPPEPAPAAPERRFWATGAAAPTTTAGATAGSATGATADSVPDPVYPVRLHPAAVLQLAARPTAADLRALREAAQPLLDLLAARGLLTRPTTEEKT